MVELRLDSIDPASLGELQEIKNDLEQAILTLRPKRQGGFYQGDEKSRISTLNNLIRLEPAYIDIELDTATSHHELISESERLLVQPILSWHYLNNTPDMPTLQKTVDKASQHSTYVKIVANARSVADNFRMMQLLRSNKALHLISFCMGELGLLSRLMAPIVGAPFTYASLDGQKTAPGQITLEEMRNFYALISDL
jgi:3-dehydroquinate dehydratase type I